ncbi:MAG: hypothetical protein ACYC6A_20065 [Armatimonadota bacterium]
MLSATAARWYRLSIMLSMLLLALASWAAPVMPDFQARVKFSKAHLPPVITAAEAGAARVLAHPGALIQVPYGVQLPFGEEMNSRAGGLVAVVDSARDNPHDIALVNVRAWEVDGPKMLKVMAECKQRGCLVIVFASKQGKPADAPIDFLIDNGGGSGKEDSAMNGIANMVNAWLWVCEYTAALTRHGKYPGILMSIMLPGAAEFDAKLQTAEGRVFLGDCQEAIPAGKLADDYIARLEKLFTDMQSPKTQQQLAAAADLIAARLQAGKKVGVSTLSHYMIGDIFLDYQSPWVPFNSPGQAKTAFAKNLQPGDLLLWIGYVGMDSPYEKYGQAIRDAKLDFIAVIVPDADPKNNAPDAKATIDMHWVVGDAEVAVPFPPGKMAPISGIDQALIYRQIDEMVTKRLAK